MDASLLILFALTFVPAVAVPGPNAAFAVAQSLKYGHRKAMLAPLGFAAATAIHVTLIFSGVGILIAKYSEIFILLKWVGVAYLFYMAYKVISSDSNAIFASNIDVSPIKIFSHSILVSLTNPKAILVGVLVFPLYINSQAPFIPQAVSIGVTAMLISFFVYSTYVVCALSLANKLKASKHSNRVVGSIYAGAGVALASVNK